MPAGNWKTWETFTKKWLQSDIQSTVGNTRREIRKIKRWNARNLFEDVATADPNNLSNALNERRIF
jgi:hypothetical protein